MVQGLPFVDRTRRFNRALSFNCLLICPAYGAIENAAKESAMCQSPDAIAEAALIELSRLQREALARLES